MNRRVVYIAIATLVAGLAYGAVDRLVARPKFEAVARFHARPHAVLDKAHAAIEIHKLAEGRYPTTEEGLAHLVKVGYLKEVPTDRWGHPINYRYPTSRSGVNYELWSFGADGTEGGTGDNRDIGNWNDDA